MVGSIDSPTVLVVEDEFLIRTDVAESLTSAGYAVLEASNADEAIAILERRKDIRLVFTDVDMPGEMDGIKLARYVANRWPPIRLVVTSGHVTVGPGDLPDDAVFCPKPCAPSRLKDTFAKLLAGGGQPAQ